jgi:hypothetical protein
MTFALDTTAWTPEQSWIWVLKWDAELLPVVGRFEVSSNRSSWIITEDDSDFGRAAYAELNSTGVEKYANLHFLYNIVSLLSRIILLQDVQNFIFFFTLLVLSIKILT